jgi:hypothetical protein
MIKSAWSLLERLFPRGASSLVLLLLASLASPELVGIYSWGALLYTLIVAITDTAMRHVVVSAVATRTGLQFIKKYQLWAFFLVPPIMALMLFLLYRQGSGTWLHYFMLSPLIVAALFLVANVANIGILQHAGYWRFLASAQFASSAMLLAVGVPLVLTTRAPVAPALSIAMAEMAMLVICWRKVRSMKLRVNYLEIDGRVCSQRATLSKSFATMSLYSSLAWSQGQLDRVLIGIIGGPYVLGIISVGVAVSRALGDAVASSNANLLRAELTNNANSSSNSRLVYAVLHRGLILSTIASLLVALPGRAILSVVLGPEWDSTLTLIPWLTLASIPAVLSWTSAVLHMNQGTTNRSLLIPLLGTCVAPLIAWLAFENLYLFALGVYMRELLLICLAYIGLGSGAPWRLFGRAILYSFMVALSVAIIPMPSM